MSIPDAVHNQTLPETAHGTWMILGVQRNKLYLQATGCGVDALRDALKDNECAFVLLALRLTLQEVPDQLRQIFIQWKGPEASAMSKVKANQLYQQAMDCLSVCAFFSFPLFSTLFFFALTLGVFSPFDTAQPRPARGCRQDRVHGGDHLDQVAAVCREPRDQLNAPRAHLLILIILFFFLPTTR